MMETLRGTLEEIVYLDEETGYVVAQVLDEEHRGELVTVVGNLASATVGELLEMQGAWVEHPRYGRQFRIETYEPLLPATVSGLRRYLSSGLIKGIGPTFASRIVEQFGLDAIEVIEKDPERLRQLPGLGEKRVARIREAWEEQREIKNLMLFLQSHGVSTYLGVKIHKTYGHGAIDIIRENPFRLAEDVWGIGFKTADRIAQSLGIPPDAPARLRSGLEHTLNEASNEGHLFLPRDELLDAASALLNAPRDALTTALAGLESDKRVIADEDSIYLASLYYAEVGAGSRLKALLKHRPIPQNPSMVQNSLDSIERELAIALEAKQRAAVVTALENPVMVLTGGPGTGKTTTVRAILALFRQLGMRVALCAPTGRAAKRITEVTGGEAKTIHRLLEFSPSDMAFRHDVDNPLELDVLIVDEVSMIDVVLLNHLLKAVPAGAHLILVGDMDQLPSVGPGSVLKDIVDSGAVPVISLTEIFRQAQGSLIVTNAHRVNHGQMPICEGAADRDFFFVEREEPEDACELLVELCVERLPKHYGFDPIWGIQVLSPMRRGVLGAENLNRRLQEALNSGGEELPRRAGAFRVGDKVMQIVNNYQKDVFNGDIGQAVVLDVEEGVLIVRYPEKDVAYGLLDLSELTLAYCTTVHKSQGSEYPAVVLPIHTQHYMMLQRNLLYTALTRAKRLVVLVGTKKALGIAIRNDQVAKRHTSLAQRLLTTPAPWISPTSL
jgi:exodeoxyribonuclease V alpha subunit